MMGPKSTPKPGSATVTEALNLLVMMGGNNKAGAKLLNEMREVQKHNEEVLAEVQSLITKFNNLQEDVEDAQGRLENDKQTSLNSFSCRKNELLDIKETLDREKSAFRTDSEARTGDLDLRLGVIDSREKALLRNEKAVTAKDSELHDREERLRKSEDANKTVRAELDKRDARMKVAMGG